MPSKPKKKHHTSQYSSTEKYLKRYFRQVWGWSSERKAALKRAFLVKLYNIEYYFCEDCRLVIERKNKEVDHCEPVVPLQGITRRPNGRIDWNEHDDRLNVPVDRLKVLCKQCHNLKTHGSELIGRVNGRRGKKK